MRRSIVGILLSVLTFAVGFGIASIRWRSTPSASSPPAIECLTPPHVPEAPKVETPKAPDFIADITGLTDFEDIDYDDLKTKLIDVHGSENLYWESELEVKGGEQWLGLFEKNEKLYLKKTKVTLKSLPKGEKYDEDYVSLATSDSGKPVFLLKNARGLKQGSVDTLYLKPSSEEMERRRLYDKPVTLGYEEFFSLGKKDYALRVNRGLTNSNQKVTALTLSLGGVSQAITYAPFFDMEDRVGRLIWVGDLDRDKKLDLYLDYSGYESCGFSAGLYLSTAAKKGELVRQVAVFSAGGC